MYVVAAFQMRLADINSTNKEGENCLFTGALYDNSKSVEKAIKMGADPTMRNEEDEAPMDVGFIGMQKKLNIILFIRFLRGMRLMTQYS